MSLPYATVEDDEATEDVELAVPELPQWRQPLPRAMRELWDSRHLLRPMMYYAIPDYAQTVLGRWWLFLRPGLPIIGYAVLVGGIFGIRAPNGVPYLIFLLFGLQGWQLFQRCIVYETRSFTRLGKFARGLNLPLVLVPTASISRALVIFSVYAGFGTITLLYYVIAKHTLYLQVNPKLLVGVAGWLLSFGFGWAVGLFTAALNARWRDVRFTLPLLMQFLMFCTPVVYPLSQVPSRYRPVAEVNPMTGVMELIKYGFLNAGQVNFIGTIWSIAALPLTAVFALWFFNRVARVKVKASDLDDEEDEAFV